MGFGEGGNELNIDSSGNVGIGTASPTNNLVVSDGGGAGLEFIPQTSNDRTTLLSYDRNTSTYQTIDFDGLDIHFNISGSEKARIDSSGNVIVGHTAADDTTASASLRYDGRIYSTVSGDQCLSLNRLASNGEIITFKKDSSIVGSIGTTSSNLYIGTGDTGVFFNSSEDAIYPINTSTIAGRDNAIDLGKSDTRFKDLYLSGNAVVSKVAGVGDTDTAIDFISPNIIAMNTGGSEAMRIDSSGNVGIGTTSPARKLHIQDSGTVWLQLTTENTTNGTAGLLFGDTNATTKTRIVNDASDNLQFWTSTEEKMRIDSSGNVGIGTTSVDRELHLKAANPRFRIEDSDGGYSEISANGGHLTLQADAGNTQGGSRIVYEIDADEKMRLDSSGNLFVGTTAGSFGAKITAESTSSYNFESRRTGTGSEGHVAFRNANGAVGTIFTNGSTTTYNTSSDARLKDVTGEARGLEVINELNPVSYNWKADGKADEGLIAQEVQEIVPNAVSGSEEEMYQMDYSKLVVHLVKAVKEQQTQIEALQSEINLLKTGE
jgi:hypothetical protein